MSNILRKITFILKKIRIRGVWLILLVAIILARKEMFWLGIGIAASGLSIRLWASGHINKDAELTVSGPYAYTRNPLYWGSLIMGLGGCIALRNYYFAVLIAALFTMVYYPTILAEEDKLCHRYGEKYQVYLNAVPRLVPRYLTPAYHVAKKFSWSRVKQNREYNAVFGFLTVLLVFDVMDDIAFPYLLSNIPIVVSLKQHYPWLLWLSPF